MATPLAGCEVPEAASPAARPTPLATSTRATTKVTVRRVRFRPPAGTFAR